MDILITTNLLHNLILMTSLDTTQSDNANIITSVVHHDAICACGSSFVYPRIIPYIYDVDDDTDDNEIAIGGNNIINYRIPSIIASIASGVIVAALIYAMCTLFFIY